MAGSSKTTTARIGVDVGGTFTDLVAFDGRVLRVHKVASTPPAFEKGVIEAVRAVGLGRAMLVHGSTVATNALLQRAGAQIAFVTTEGFADMLTIGRQNRPDLYALRVRRPEPIARRENCFTVRERIGGRGEVITPLEDAAIQSTLDAIEAKGLKHVAVCLLFSFTNPAHERRIAEACARRGLICTTSSELLPEFREYERASTAAINASLRPVVAEYLAALERGIRDVLSAENAEPEAARHPDDSAIGTEGMGEPPMRRAGDVPSVAWAARPCSSDPSGISQPDPPHSAPAITILHSSGGTLDIPTASKEAAKLVLSGPAGGVLGAAFVAGLSGISDIITYDMGGTSTDVATILGGKPQWTTATRIDGLPIALPMFDIHTVGAGGGSIAYLDTGGALRVGPRSAGAAPGPACYGRGGTEPTVTDANLILGRIVPGQFLGGRMSIDVDLARRAIEPLARAMGKSVVDTAIGIVTVAEANMEHAIRHVTSRRGHDPRQFALVSFGGAGGLHACALAAALEIPRVLVPPHAGVLSALGMVVAPAVADAAQTVVHLGDALDDDRLAAEFGRLSGQTMDIVSYEQTAAVEVYADVRFKGQSHEVKVKLDRPSRSHIAERFVAAYTALYGQAPTHRPIEIVTLRVRRIGHSPQIALRTISPDPAPPATTQLIPHDGRQTSCPVLTRAMLLHRGPASGPLLLIDPEATTYVPPGWHAAAGDNGTIVLSRETRDAH